MVLQVVGQPLTDGVHEIQLAKIGTDADSDRLVLCKEVAPPSKIPSMPSSSLIANSVNMSITDADAFDSQSS